MIELVEELNKKTFFIEGMKMPKDIVSADAEEGQIIDVIDIEGSGPKYAKELKAVGIRTSEDLRKSSLVEVVDATKISPKLTYRWKSLSDLARLKRVAESNITFNRCASSPNRPVPFSNSS